MRLLTFLYLLTVTSFCLAEYQVPPAPPEVQRFDSGPAERQPCSWYDLSFPKSLDAEINGINYRSRVPSTAVAWEGQTIRLKGRMSLSGIDPKNAEFILLSTSTDTEWGRKSEMAGRVRVRLAPGERLDNLVEKTFYIKGELRIELSFAESPSRSPVCVYTLENAVIVYIPPGQRGWISC